jgi:N-acetylglucosaminylphosphatidylinositol deacetylase
LNDVKLPDGMQNNWDVDYVKKKIEEHVEKWSIEVILTFDKQGVSGHRNHIACYHGTM